MKAALHIINARAWAKHKDKLFDISRFVADAAETGYAGVEIGGGEAMLGSPDRFGKMLEQHGLQVAAYGCAVTANPWPQNTREYRAAMDAAVAYGAKMMAICGGFLGNNRRTTYPADYDLFAENLSRAIEYAKERGLACSFHPHRGCIVETIAETQFMVDRLPELQLCCDTAHLASVGEDAVAFIKRFGDRITHTHIKDYDSRDQGFAALGTGDGSLDVGACLDALRSAGYDGWLSVELDGQPERPPDEAARISREFLRQNGVK